MAPTTIDQALWKEERLRYQLLRFVFEEVGRECTDNVSAPEIGTALDLPPRDVVRLLNWLLQRGYARRIDSQPHVCVTMKGVSYFEEGPERRQSLRN